MRDLRASQNRRRARGGALLHRPAPPHARDHRVTAVSHAGADAGAAAWAAVWAVASAAGRRLSRAASGCAGCRPRRTRVRWGRS
jgi:hypothetical protein